MTANEIIGREDFLSLVKYAIAKGLAKKQQDVDDFAQEVAMHIIKYPPKKEYAASTVIMKACEWVQKEKGKKRKQEKFEDKISLIDPLDLKFLKFNGASSEHRDFNHVDHSDELDEIVANAELTSQQLTVINGIRNGKTQKMITAEGTTTRQNVALHYKNALRKMQECIVQS